MSRQQFHCETHNHPNPNPQTFKQGSSTVNTRVSSIQKLKVILFMHPCNQKPGQNLLKLHISHVS